jgi:hypothetical protein
LANKPQIADYTDGTSEKEGFNAKAQRLVLLVSLRLCVKKSPFFESVTDCKEKISEIRVICG